MFCLLCRQFTTRVVNSRQNTKDGRIWRRRKCSDCAFIFTTYEKPSLEQIKVGSQTNKEEMLRHTKLLLSIASCFEHNPENRSIVAESITDTVVIKLVQTHGITVTSEQISKVTYETLSAFDRLASVQYAAKHTDHLKHYLRV